jgi:hypothetical protein
LTVPVHYRENSFIQISIRMRLPSTKVLNYRMLAAGSLLLSLLLVQMPGKAQVTPESGTVQCFQVGTDGLFVDTGGPGGNDDIQDFPGNYPDCDCVTTTTLCSTDGSAVTLDFQAYGVFAAFDWTVILDTDNPFEEVYPASVLTDPLNVNLQLFNNADGVGDGGSENYGLGSEVGLGTLAEMPTTTFTATNPTGCLTMVFRSSAVVDDSGWEALISVASGAAHPGDDIACDNSTLCFPPNNIQTDNLTATSTDITWNSSPSTDNYEVEYGPAGFVPGTGTTIVVNGATTTTLTGLMENTTYDVYIQAICDNNETSAWVLYQFTTPFLNPPDECAYTLELFDTFGDGWNGAQLTVDVNGAATVYTIPPGGDEAFFTFNVVEGLPVILTYSPGTFENEVSYFMYDSDGLLLFNDGPFPQTGEVYNEIAVCPDCPAVVESSVETESVGLDTAVINWDVVTSAESYIIEYAPTPLPFGNGIQVTTNEPPITLTGLNPCVTYEYYVTAVCSGDTLSQPVGPFEFMTEMDLDPGADPCDYTLELFDSFGDGWNGSTLEVTILGNTTPFTIPPGGDQATYVVSATPNVPITFTYNPGTFENEVSFNIIDPSGTTVYSDGPFPQTGEIYSEVACPTCLGPTNFEVIDVNANNAILNWAAPGEAGDIELEYGPIGFTLGTGTALVPTDAGPYTLTGLEEGTWYNVYLSYDCDTGEKGKTLGPLTFRTIWFNDVGISGIVSPTAEDCNLSAAETLEVLIQNYGQSPQSLIPYFFAVNGQVQPVQQPTDGFFTGVVSNDSSEVAEFDLTFDFSTPGYYLIEIWTELDGDSDVTNDTFTFELITAFPLPLQEDFEDQTFPEGWSTDEFNPIYGPNAHNNPTVVAADLLGTFDSNFELSTFRVGPLGDTDSLSFDYRFVNSFAGTIATPLGDSKLDVFISTDCEETYELLLTIDSSNHVESVDFQTRVVDLSAYSGEAINILFQGTYATGTPQFWCDLDNINISGCPESLVLLSSINDATGTSNNDGSILVEPQVGSAPYTYVWDNGQVGNPLTGVIPGDYTVTVTDANGCTDQATFSVVVNGVDDLPFLTDIVLRPNPTTGITVLDVDLAQREDLTVQVFNAMGQQLFQFEEQAVKRLTREIDLTAYPAGIYYVRLAGQQKMHIEKLILAE